MLRADQLALFQQANQKLLHIRKLELDYFVQVFSRFGTQGALFAGFAINFVIIQIDFDARDHQIMFKWICWIVGPLIAVLALQCTLTTTFANIFGSGYALRGATGSMLRAISGLMSEQTIIFTYFTTFVLLFQVLAFAVGFLVMDKRAAIVCSAVLAVGGYYWYVYCLRIYNRFRIRASTRYRQSGREGEFSSSQRRNSGSDSASGAIALTTRRNKIRRRSNSSNSSSDSSSEGYRAPQFNHMEGYLSKKGRKGGVFSDMYSRRYFVIEDENMLYYTSREAYHMNPENPIKTRPISLPGYALDSTSNDLCLTLRPLDEDDARRVWEFRCDTEDEKYQWSRAFIRGGAELSTNISY